MTCAHDTCMLPLPANLAGEEADAFGSPASVVNTGQIAVPSGGIRHSAALRHAAEATSVGNTTVRCSRPAGGDQPRPEMTFLDFGSETRRHKGGDFGATAMGCFDGPQDEFEIGR
jgi:hypothetical protein